MPFRYEALVIFLDGQMDFLLKENILSKTDQDEYNALWDTLIDIKQFFSYADDPTLVIGCEISVLKIFDYNFKSRNK